MGVGGRGPLAGDTVRDRKTILLVEDNPNDVGLTLEALADYRLANDIVTTARRPSTTSIGAAGSRGASPRPRVGVLDLKMPRVDGLAVLRTVKADPALKPSPSCSPPRARSATSSRATSSA